MYSPSPNFFYDLVLNFVIAVGKMRRKLSGVFNLFLPVSIGGLTSFIGSID